MKPIEVFHLTLTRVRGVDYFFRSGLVEFCGLEVEDFLFEVFGIRKQIGIEEIWVSVFSRPGKNRVGLFLVGDSVGDFILEIDGFGSVKLYEHTWKELFNLFGSKKRYIEIEYIEDEEQSR